MAQDNGWLERWSPLAHRVARYMFRRFPATETPFDAMLDAALLKAWELDQYNVAEAYMAHRMRYAIIDELRRNTWGVRSGKGFRAHRSTGYDEQGYPHTGTCDPDVTARIDVERGLAQLPMRERQIIRHRDLEGQLQHELGERFKVSPERISQLRTAGLKRLRELMSDDEDDL